MSIIHEIPRAGTFELTPKGSYRRVITRQQAIKRISEEDTALFNCDVIRCANEGGFIMDNGDILFYSFDSNR
jgi:hypothetical protein